MHEVVKYVLLQGTTILVEHRVADATHKDDAILIPGGGIEEEDRHSIEDYREKAMLREIAEELQGQVQVLSYEYLGEFIHPERKFIFYVYLITDWEGTIPEYIIENGQPDGKLSWMEREAFLQESSNRVNQFIITALLAFLEKNNYG